MTVYFNKSRKTWMYNFALKGERYQGYCRDEDGNIVTAKRDAEAFEAKYKAVLRKKERTELFSPNAYLFGEAVIAYKKDRSKKRTINTNLRCYLKELLNYFGLEKPVESFTLKDIEDYIEFSRSQRKKIYMGDSRDLKDTAEQRKDSTTNRYLNTLRAVLNLARDTDHVKYVVKVKRLEEEQDIPRPIPNKDLKKIYDNAPEHLKLILILAAYTGLRLNEALSLTWDKVYLEEKLIRLDTTTKAKKGDIIFLNEVIYNMLCKMEKVSEYVVTYKGKPIKSIKHSWETAQRKASIKNTYKFHNTRASFCTLIGMQKNASPQAITELARHKSTATTARYLKAQNSQLRELVENIKI